MAKPWLTKGVLTTVKHRQKLYKSHFLCRDPDNVKEYKLYANTVNLFKHNAENYFYYQHFKFHQNDLKNAWKLIGTLVKRKNKGPNCPVRIKGNSIELTSELDIAEQFNQHFIDVVPNLAKTVSNTAGDPCGLINHSPLHSFFFLSPVTEKWVDKNDKKSSLDVPNKSVRLASKSSLSHLHLFLLIQFLLALCLII